MAETHPDTEAVQRMWGEFTAATGVEGELVGSFAFGDSPKMADDLAQLVLTGPKRATAGLHLEYVRDGEAIPRPGDHWIVLDGRGGPVCVIRTTRVDIEPLDRVDAAFAWDEGEGDRTLAWWRQAHDRFFGRQCETFGIPFTGSLLVVLERFDLAWPAAATVDG